MKFRIFRVTPDIWKKNFSEYAHKYSFGEVRCGDRERIDYALLAVNEEELPCGYMTCREIEERVVYWQFGGAFPPIEKTVYPMRLYGEFLKWHLERYDRIVTYIENKNTPMLKMAMKIGFLVTGIRTFENAVLLENTLKKGDRHV